MLRALVAISVLATLVVNGLANALPINGQTTGEISDRFPVLFTPAGYVFSIWGLIYLGLAAIAVYQALPGQAGNPRLARARGWLALSGAANIAWLLLWHYEQFPLTLVAMLTLLATLVLTYQRLDIGRQTVTSAERWLAQLPIGIYLGWISVATIANAAVVLESLGWGGWGIAAPAWTLIMIAAATALGWILALRRGEWAFSLVLAWAFAGIAVRNAGVVQVTTGAWIAFGLALFSVAAAARWASSRRSRTSPVGT